MKHPGNNNTFPPLCSSMLQLGHIFNYSGQYENSSLTLESELHEIIQLDADDDPSQMNSEDIAVLTSFVFQF
ncbi:hypothetical protein SS50377_21510 [Spironucleus salmonicida]|uniref:Uncharacterized protein n=1 Tax=Spironucleus salmonicida TaxID=348837 RepID=V6LMP4_9EUKA|nr:hypothetical protein SS50377_21510 [Spironucleus salmonicida]|eukprot:EST45488.1 Hypothetical protein SS50377_14557 [Spironucleus salmonicida]